MSIDGQELISNMYPPTAMSAESRTRASVVMEDVELNFDPSVCCCISVLVDRSYGLVCVLDCDVGGCQFLLPAVNNEITSEITCCPLAPDGSALFQSKGQRRG